MTNAPDYNDGKWHGWNGGECPVPGAHGDITYVDGFMVINGRLDVRLWNQPLMFRVTKPAQPKPREVWLIEGVMGMQPVRGSETEAMTDAAALRSVGYKGVTVARFREVLE